MVSVQSNGVHSNSPEWSLQNPGISHIPFPALTQIEVYGTEATPITDSAGPVKIV